MWVQAPGAFLREGNCQPGVLGQIPSTYLLKLWIFNWFEKYIVNWQEEKQLKDFLTARGKSGGPILKHLNSHLQSKIHILHFLNPQKRAQEGALKVEMRPESCLVALQVHYIHLWHFYTFLPGGDFIFKQLFALSLFKIALNGIISLKE